MALRAFHPDFGGEVRYDFETLPADPDAQVERTVARVIHYLLTDSAAPIIQEFAQRALILGEGDPILGVWRICKQQMRFVHDEDTAQKLAINDARKPDVIEVLIRPVDQALLIALKGTGFEDCDGYTMFAACLLLALGVPCKLVTIAAVPSEPRKFSHIYIAAYPGGRRIPLDFSHGPFPGWEGPNTGRIKEWALEEHTDMRSVLATLAALGVAAYFLSKQARAAA